MGKVCDEAEEASRGVGARKTRTLTLSSKGEGGNLTEGEWPQRGIKGTKSGEGRGDEKERASEFVFFVARISSVRNRAELTLDAEG